MRFGLLGGLTVEDDAGTAVPVGGPLPRALLSVLLLAEGRPVHPGRLLEALWDGEPPASATATLHSTVSRLRRSLLAAGAGERVLVSEPAGYRLLVDDRSVDARQFVALVGRGRAALEAGDLAAAAGLLREADDLWRGPALAEVADRGFAQAVASRLEEQRLAAAEDRFDAELTLGRHAAVLPELVRTAAEHPLRERLQGAVALAHYRAGCQADAVAVLAATSATLREELGLDLSPPLRALELQLLRQDPALDLPPAVQSTPAPTRHPTPSSVGRPVSASSQAPLVGRHPELSALLSTLEDSATLAQFGVVDGEPGIGKTRLLEEVASIAAQRGALVLWGRSHESGAAPAFWPWLPVLRAVRERDESAVTAPLSNLLDARGEAHPTGLFDVFDAVLQAVRRISRDQQLVVLLDDLQWADTASLELLGYLASHLGDDRVLLLAAVRDAPAEPRADLVTVLATVSRRRGSRRLQLRGLEPAATAELVRSAAVHGVDDAVATAIHERGAGNPFFVTELARLLDAGDGGRAAASAVPVSVRDVVRRRLAALPADTTGLLTLCAVAGRMVDLPLLADATGHGLADLLPQLEPALQHRMLTEAPDSGGALQFVHALVREVLVEDLSVLRRRQLHLQVADALERRGDDDAAELLAEHLWSALPLGRAERAAAALERAAEVALARFALQSVDDLLSRAVELRRQQGTGDEHALAELHALVRLTSARRALRGFGGVADLLARGEQLARQVGRDDVERELAWATWAMADTACDFDRALPIALRLRALLADQDPVLRQFGAQVWGIQCWHQGRIVEAREHLDLAFAEGERVAAPSGATLLSFAGERELLGKALWLAVHELTEDDATAPATLDELSRSVDTFGAAVVAVLASHAPSVRGDVARVRSLAEPVVTADRDGLMSFWGSLARMHLGWARMCQGEVDAGLALWQEGRTVYAGSGLHTGMGLFLANAAEALLHAGRPEQAADLAGQAREELDVHRELWPEPIVLLVEAQIAAGAGHDPGPLLDAALLAAESRAMTGAARRVLRTAQRLQG